MPRLLSALALVPILALTSCIDGEETVWLKRNGSGRLEAAYHLPDAVIGRFGGPNELVAKLKAAIDADPEIHLDHIGHERADDGRIRFHFSAKFDDLRALVVFPQKRLRNPAAPDTPVPAEALFGEMDLEINQLLIALRRKIDLAPLLTDVPPPFDKALKNNPALFGDATLVYRVHMPVAATTHDATTVSADGKTLEWSFLLRDHLTKPIYITTKAPLPLPWWIWFTLVLVAIVFLALLFLAARWMIVMRS